MEVKYVLTCSSGTKTKVWALAEFPGSWEYILTNGHTYIPYPRYILIWGALDGKLSSRRIHSYASHHRKMCRDKIHNQNYVVAEANSAAMSKVLEHLDKHLAWEQLAGITEDYARKKMQFD